VTGFRAVMKSDGFLQITKLVAIICMDCVKNEERRIIPSEALFLFLGEVWS
jgi:hypothetical protein